MCEDYTHQRLRQKIAELEQAVKDRCDECGADLIGPCFRCGAPVCCPQCCLIDTLRADLKAAQEEAIEAMGAEAWILEWMEAEKYKKPDIPRIINKAREHYRETLQRAEQAEKKETALEQKNAKLVAALEPFAALYRVRTDWHPYEEYLPRNCLASYSLGGKVTAITSADCYRAEQAINEEVTP